MSLFAQAQRLGFPVVGKLTPAEGRDSHCRYFLDDAGNTFILRHGILTIVTASGRVY